MKWLQKFTPGPWFVSGIDIVSRRPSGATLYYIAQTTCGLGRDEEDANARLIAAAPDLLEALRDSLDYLSCIPESAVGGDDDAAKLCRLIRAALSRATEGDAK